jgi:hypothetical protein
MDLQRRSTLSTAVTNAQKLAAQYAWFNPRVKGNRRDNSCGICPIIANGPREAMNTPITAFAKARKFLISTCPPGVRQNARRRYTKYAGYAK